MAEMTINPREITEALRRNLDGWSPSLEAATVGYVTSIGDGVARIEGLPGAMSSELLEFPGGLLGVALNLDEDSIGAVIMGEASHVQEGEPGRQTGRGPAGAWGGAGAAADGQRGDGCQDPERPRPAPVDHRRPRHGQDGGGGRHD